YLFIYSYLHVFELLVWQDLGLTIKSHSDSSRSGSSFSNGSGKRYWSYNSPAGSSTSYRRPTQEPNLYSQNYRYSSRYPWDSYDAKPWRPKPPKAKLKDVAGEVIVGAAGGFLLGGSLSHMELYFWDPKEERWWYEHRDSYPDMVYFRNYDQRPAPFMTFIEDCVNITVSKFIVNQTDEMEIKVVPHVVRQMCKEEYIENLFRPSRERKPGEIAKMTNTGGTPICLLLSWIK
uniref:Prion/Doppel protein beta-ribbon domain-containing protein n=1 Tax=Anolis carolinensis TaxID=28377 RepID=A0A803TG39_ANOCA